MWQKVSAKNIFLVIITSALFVFPTVSYSRAQSGTQPRTVHNNCTGSCVVDTIMLHSGMGDSTAQNAYHGWYGSYYTGTSCDSPVSSTFEFLLDVIGDIAGAPGAPTLQCWQGLLAQASQCSDTCSDYFISDAAYAPNVRLSLDWGSPGALSVTADNTYNLNKLPELQPNTYSRSFHLRTSLSRDNGTALVVNDAEMPSLSFPNWITRGGYSDCLDSFGADDNRCRLLEGLVTSSEVSHSVEFLDGTLYDLTEQVDDLSDASGSFAQAGFITLDSDGDSITINQGPYAGFLWVKTHNRSNDTHSQQVIPWDASGSAQTIVNHECVSLFSTCWITGDRADSDVYVFALQGPAEKRLPGTYTVSVTAEMDHDRDFNDNSISYTYDAEAGSTDQTGADTDTDQQETLPLSSLTVIDLPGEGVYPGTMPQDAPGVMYRLNVPAGIQFLYISLTSIDGSAYSYFVRHGSIPVPDYPIINDDYDCWTQSDASYNGGCPFTNPYPDAYYIFVSRLQGNTSFSVEIDWRTAEEAATQQTIHTQTAVPLVTATPIPLENTFTEVEVNDSRSTANSWDMTLPFSGQIQKASDRDYILLTITQPGIYTFSLTNVGSDLRAKLSLVRHSTGNYLDHINSATKGQSLSLAFDGSPGEQYDLIVSKLSSTTNEPNQTYLLSLSGFIPDPLESNDDLPTAVVWDISQPVQGYFWDKTTGRADYYQFTAPQTLEGTPIIFSVTNPSHEMRVRISLFRSNGLILANTPYSYPGEPAQLTHSLEGGKPYYIKLELLAVKTSLQPYTFSAAFTPGSTGDDLPTEGGKTFRLTGLVIEQGRFVPHPIKDAAIYVQVTGQPQVLLDTTNSMGVYAGTISMAEGQSVAIWAEKTGLNFLPDPELWSFDLHARSHRTVFRVTGAQLLKETLMATPPLSTTGEPPLIQTALAATPTPVIAQPSLTSVSQRSSPVPSISVQATSLPPQGTPPPPQQGETVTITGFLWRLFPNSAPAGVAASDVILSINGVDQPSVFSMIDGSYTITVSNVKPGDTLSLRAQGTEDTYEPSAYTWQQQAGVTAWQYDFYSYWDTIQPPASDGGNRIYGRVTDPAGQGIPGIYLVVQMGTSDALQRIGPTDSNGYYEGTVQLPTRIMASVWVEQPGYIPAKVQFFHAYVPENREVNFSLPPNSK